MYETKSLRETETKVRNKHPETKLLSVLEYKENNRSDELKHHSAIDTKWGIRKRVVDRVLSKSRATIIEHGADSDEREGHKYIARVPLKKPTKKRKYRYFYDDNEYESYLKTAGVDANYHGSGATLADLISSIAFTKIAASTALIETGVKILDKLFSHEDIKLSDIIKDPNDKESVYEEYQNKEPEFMKDVPEIDPPTSSEEDMEEINEDYSPYDTEHSQNCMNCTTAYELRQRGYDVQASSDSDGYGLFDLKEWYEDPEPCCVNGNGEAVSLKPIVDKNKNIFSRAELAKFIKDNADYENYTSVNVASAIINKSGNNSRGNLMASWKGGSGHSMVYEVVDNELIIRDCQTNTMVDMSDLIIYSADICFVRTDNLQLKKGVLNVVERN